jgi:hypothetical protein
MDLLARIDLDELISLDIMLTRKRLNNVKRKH